MGLTYHIIDVFTERAFGGNPLAVVLDADNLTAAEMLQIADGCIVGSSLKVDGHTWNRVDPDRARRFVDAARR